ncbi:MAG: hypothetical protein H0V85_00220 [Thermoleophilaceae bacterium]|nr:hypothetical protein [Thermoleophilaceae bacterium]
MRLATVATVLLCGLLAGSAEAVHWPVFGGEGGRSGYQAEGEGSEPLTPVYTQTGASKRNIVTSVVATSGQPGGQRVAFGTADGRILLRILESGDAVGAEGGVSVDQGGDDPDTFTGAGGSVSFADTSGPRALGQLFAVHNDDDQGGGSDDIALAQVDETSGRLVRDVPIAGTDGYTVSSSVLASAPAASSGVTRLFFVAGNGTTERLFRVPVTNAGAVDAVVGRAQATGDIDATTLGSPANVRLRTASGGLATYAAVGTASHLRTYSQGELAPGPASGPLPGPAQTPSVPAQASGAGPEATGRAGAPSPSVYVATRVGEQTSVVRLVQDGNGQTLRTVSTSSALPGAPAPALAVDRKVVRGTARPGAVFVTTAANLYFLGSEDLRRLRSFSASPLAPGLGFGRTTAAASGPLVYVSRDSGRPLVLRRADARAVPWRSFAPPRGASASTAAVGQPSISRSFVQFAGSGGLFVYRNRCGNNLFTLTDEGDRISGTAAGDVIPGGRGNDRLTGSTGDDCLLGEQGDDSLDGGPGSDSLAGAGGDDRLAGGRSGDDKLSGGNGDDQLRGGSGRDLLIGGGGRDLLVGGDGNDRVRGDAGRDRIDAGAGRNSIDAGPGSDRVDAANDRSEVVDCGLGRDVATVDRGDRTRGCERVSRR